MSIAFSIIGSTDSTVWPTPPENFVPPLQVTVDIADIIF
jgi:hypothetical protein